MSDREFALFYIIAVFSVVGLLGTWAALPGRFAERDERIDQQATQIARLDDRIDELEKR